VHRPVEAACEPHHSTERGKRTLPENIEFSTTKQDWALMVPKIRRGADFDVPRS
jgi:hypothetical protein